MTVNEKSYIDIKEMISTLWLGKQTIMISFVLSIVISSLYIYNSPTLFVSNAVLSPVEKQDISSSLSNSLGGLASFAGVNFGQSDNSLAKEAQVFIKSFNFFQTLQFDSDMKALLVALDEWDQDLDLLIFDSSKFDSSKKIWKGPFAGMPNGPSDQYAYRAFRNIFSISEDAASGFVYLSITHRSPKIAKEWMELVIERINSHIKEQERIKAINSISYLQNQLKSSNLLEIRQVISSLISKEMQTIALAESSDDFVFKVIEPPYASEYKSSPVRSLILIIGGILGLLGGIFIIFFKKLYN